jgi:hypothetical protein
MKRYVGSRLEKGCVVSVIDDTGLARDLDLQLRVRNHSPTGFEWGYGGSGAAQLALALCIDALSGNVPRAQLAYQGFKWLTIARLSRDRWSLTQDEVLAAITAVEQAHANRAPRPAGVEPF